MVVGLLLKGRGRRLWKEVTPQRSLCSPVRFASQGVQRGDFQWSDIRAHLALPPGPVNRDGGLLCSCSHRLSRLMDTMPVDACTSNKTSGSCSGGECVDKGATKECCEKEHYGGLSCFPHPVYKSSFTSEPASSNSRYALGKTSLKISVFAASSSSANYSSIFINSLPQQSRRICSGFWSWRRRETPSPFTQSRSYSSLGNKKTSSDHTSQLSEDSILRLGGTDASEVDTDAAAPLPEGDDNDFDFRNFPALTSSHFQDYERPTHMQVKKRVTWQTKSKLFNTDTKLTEECIPKRRGRTYDFGLGDMLSSPPPIEAGARPQGGFDTNISLDECEAAPPSEVPSWGSLLFAVGLPVPNRHNLPKDTPLADNGSEISADDAQRSEDCVQEPVADEFSWEMCDFDVIAEFSHSLEAEENVSANVVS